MYLVGLILSSLQLQDKDKHQSAITREAGVTEVQIQSWQPCLLSLYLLTTALLHPASNYAELYRGRLVTLQPDCSASRHVLEGIAIVGSANVQTNRQYTVLLIIDSCEFLI